MVGVLTHCLLLSEHNHWLKVVAEQSHTNIEKGYASTKSTPPTLPGHLWVSMGGASTRLDNSTSFRILVNLKGQDTKCIKICTPQAKYMPFIIAQNFFLSPRAFYYHLFQLHLANAQALIELEVSMLNMNSNFLFFWLSVDKYKIY